MINLDRTRPQDAGLGLPGRFCQIDLADAGAVYDAFHQFRPEGVCHLAANPSPSGHARTAVFDNNVRTAYYVMQAAGDLGARRVVYASSEMATGLLTEGRRRAGSPSTSRSGCRRRTPTPSASTSAR